MSAEELKEVSSAIESYNKEVNDFIEKILNEDSGVEMEKLDTSNLEKLLDANDIEASQLAIIYTHIS